MMDCCQTSRSYQQAALDGAGGVRVASCVKTVAKVSVERAKASGRGMI
jgi:hypothetical protein